MLKMLYICFGERVTNFHFIQAGERPCPISQRNSKNKCFKENNNYNNKIDSKIFEGLWNKFRIPWLSHFGTDISHCKSIYM